MSLNKPDSQNTEPSKVEAKDNSIAIGSIEVHGNVEGGIHIGNTIIQKFFNIFKSDSETLEHRNRRILLGHVENAWIKGVLDASLHGAALLDLGIKQDLEAVTKYPWAIKKESTDETLPAGTSMLEIFENIGMGRSLLILGAPGSGKTTMLLELARGLIARAREDVTQSIPMVFNLASWTEKLTLADWLAQELNNLYSVPRKTAPDWVKGDKLLLLLDGLDEVRQESRAKCVEAINAFRKEHGLTSLAVCSRSQDYADLNAKLSFEGAIEVQPLTQGQITEFFNRFGDEMTGIKQALEKDRALREMAKTPLFLSIMLIAYSNKEESEIIVSQDRKFKREHLINNYVNSMMENPRAPSKKIEKDKLLNHLGWLARMMISEESPMFLLEKINKKWLSTRSQKILNEIIVWIIGGFLLGLIIGFIYFLIFGWGTAFGVATYYVNVMSQRLESNLVEPEYVNKIVPSLVLIAARWVIIWIFLGIVTWIFFGIFVGSFQNLIEDDPTVLMQFSSDGLLRKAMYILGVGLLLEWIILYQFDDLYVSFMFFVFVALYIFVSFLDSQSISNLIGEMNISEIKETIYPNQGILFAFRNAFLNATRFGSQVGLVIALLTTLLTSRFWFSKDPNWGFAVGLFFCLMIGLIVGTFVGSFAWTVFGGLAIIRHYTLRIQFLINDHMSFDYISFLTQCVNLSFLRRVGGGYIFVHRLLMEHFAEMYVETPTSKGN